MKVWLGKAEYRAYTITIIEKTKEDCKKKLLKEFNKATGERMTQKEYGDYYGWNVIEMTIGKAEWL